MSHKLTRSVFYSLMLVMLVLSLFGCGGPQPVTEEPEEPALLSKVSSFAAAAVTPARWAI